MLPTILSQRVVPAPVRAVLTRLQAAGFEAFLVGGCVRDMLRGVTPRDFDVTTSALPEQVREVFPKVIPTGIQHGTVTVVSSGLHVEVTTFRSEGSYIDGRRPTSVAFHSDVKEDLARRDFTINAMAFDPERQQLVDPFDGQGDLAAQRIRAVGRAEERFAEDGLRALRAARFAAVLGFSLEPSTEAAIPGTLAVFRKVSMERVREEFTKLLLAPWARVGLDVLFRTGLLGAFLPEVLPEFEAARKATLATPVELEVRLSALLHRVGLEDGSDEARARCAESVLERLKFPLRVQRTVATLIRYRALMEGARNEIDARKAVSTFELEMLAGLLSLSEAVRGGAPTPLRALYEKALEGNPPLSIRELALNGGQMMAVLKVGPGPKVGEASRFLLQKVLENPTLNSPSRLVELLEEWDHPQPA